MNNKKEYIICAAVCYGDLTFPNSDVIANSVIKINYSLPKNISKGIVICGHRHYNCLYTMHQIFGIRQSEAGHEKQGFLTSLNRFVNRTDATNIAIEAGQIPETKRGYLLYSEDIY